MFKNQRHALHEILNVCQYNLYVQQEKLSRIKNPFKSRENIIDKTRYGHRFRPTLTDNF